MKTLGTLKNHDFIRMSSNVYHPWIAEGDDGEWLWRIHSEFARLTPMGDDGLRHFWIPIPLKSGHQHAWYDVCSYEIDGQPILRIIDHRGYLCEITTYAANQGRRLDDADFLQNFYEMVQAWVDEIVAAPENFNRFVEQELPHGYRYGRISRAALNQLAPAFRVQVEDEPFVVNMLKKMMIENLQLLPTMSIRTFCRYYRIAMEKFVKEPHDATLSDIDFYQRHGLGRWPGNANMDSEDDFMVFAFDHYGELGLSRINIRARQPLGEGKGWCLHVSTSYSSYVGEFLDIAVELYRTGVPLQIGEAQKLLAIIEERDDVRIQPFVFHDYLCHHDEGTAMRLPDLWECDSPDSVWTRTLRQQVIAATEWQPLDVVKVD